MHNIPARESHQSPKAHLPFRPSISPFLPISFPVSLLCPVSLSPSLSSFLLYFLSLCSHFSIILFLFFSSDVDNNDMFLWNKLKYILLNWYKDRVKGKLFFFHSEKSRNNFWLFLIINLSPPFQYIWTFFTYTWGGGNSRECCNMTTRKVLVWWIVLSDKDEEWEFGIKVLGNESLCLLYKTLSSHNILYSINELVDTRSDLDQLIIQQIM